MNHTRDPSVILLTIGFVLMLGLLVSFKPVGAAELEPPVLPPPLSGHMESRADYNWTISNMDGSEVGFSTFRNRVVFLHFWATWCPHCKVQMSGIQQLYDALKDNEDIQFVMASYQEVELVQRYMRKKHFSLPVYFYHWEVPKGFGPSERMPRTVIIDREGRIVYKHVGAVDWNDGSVIEFLESLCK